MNHPGNWKPRRRISPLPGSVRMGRAGNVLAVAVLAAAPLEAQNYAQITGTVADPTGAVVAGARITVVNESTGQTRNAETNATGNYTVPFLVPGVYDLRTELEGFKSATRDDLELQVGDTARVDFRLEIGAVTEVVEVTGGAPLLNSENAVVGTVIENRRIAELPLNGRNYLQMISLTSNVTAEMSAGSEGVARKGGERAQQVFSIAGMRNASNRYTLDGIENTEVSYGLFALRPSIDALQEFNVQTGIYSAEYGRNPSQVTVATKSGSNEFHGTVFEFHRNENLDAKEWRLSGDKNPFVRNQFGFTLGGRLIRDRLFFMSNFESLRESKTLQQIANVAPDRMRAGDLAASGRRIFDPLSRVFSVDPQGNPRAVSALPFPNDRIPRSRFHPISVKLLEFYPEATEPGDNILRNFSRNAPRQVSWEQFTQRIDVIESLWSSWFGRFSWGDEFSRELATFEHQEQNIVTIPYQAMLANTRTFGPTLVNEFRFGYSLFQNDQNRFFAGRRDITGELGIIGLNTPAENAWGTPSIGLGLGLSGFGEQVNGPFIQNSHVFQWIDNVSWIRGNHSFKFGGEIRRDRFNETGVPFQRGSFAFRGTATEDPANRGRTGHPFADLLIGESGGSQRSRISSNGQLRATSFAFYFEDTWKLTPRFTINLGLRYENTPPYHDKHRGAINVLFFDPGVGPNGLLPDTRVPVSMRTGAGDFHEGLPYHVHDGVPKASGDDNLLPRTLVRRDNNDFAPRVGLAWRPSDKWTVRTGAGLFYSQDIGEIRFDLSRNIGGRSNFQSDLERPNSNLSDPWRVEREEFVCSNWAGDCQGPTFTLANNTRRRTPYIAQWMLNLQRQVDSETAVELGYMGSAGSKLERLRLWNQAINRAGPDDFSPLSARRPWPDYQFILTADSVVNSSYNALNVKLRRRFAKGLTYLVGFTWGKSIDNGSGIRVRGGDNENPTNNYDLRRERGLSQFHTGRRLVASLLYELPFARQPGLMNKLFGGWQLGSIITFSDGTPVNVGSIGDRNNTQTGTPPDATGISPIPAARSSENFWNIRAFDDSSPELFFRDGNVGRNVLTTPGVSQWDFSATKTTPIKEGHMLQFRFEAFNFTNHPNWNSPAANPLAPATFGRVVSARTMRELQFGLKYLF